MTREIPLTRGYVALVDDEDYERVAAFKWFAQVVERKSNDRVKVYAARNIRVGTGQRLLLMHRALTDAPRGLDVDHINGNGCDNTRANLRVCTRSENLLNRPAGPRKRKSPTGVEFKGVRLLPSGRWLAVAWVPARRKATRLGVFDTQAEAAFAVDNFIKFYHGEFAVLNLLEAVNVAA